jgi:alpha-L-fucosidase
MKTNGSAIYGSHAWSIPGEGQSDAQGRMLMIPGGIIGNNQARVAFTARDFRFTVGKNGHLFAICMAVPQPGSVLTINALGTGARRLDKPVTSVRLLGEDDKPLVWKQDATSLSITCPAAMPFATAVVFEIE